MPRNILLNLLAMLILTQNYLSAQSTKPSSKPILFHPNKPAQIIKADSIKEIDIVCEFVAGGQFEMGTADSKYAIGSMGNTFTEPLHSETVKSFYMGKYEITQAQWKSVMNYNESHFHGCDKCPVENVTWHEIQDFLVRLNQLTGKKYRLPTEAEWEFAATGGSKSKHNLYSGSNNTDGVIRNMTNNYVQSGSINPDAVSWNKGNSHLVTHPVGFKQPNELGLYDMIGNVQEFCSNWYGEKLHDPNIFTNTNSAMYGNNKVIRGGCIYDELYLLQIKQAIITDSLHHAPGTGFRVALSSL